MRSWIGMAGLLALAACGPDEAPKNEAVPSPTPRPTPKPGPTIAGVDLNKPLQASGAGWTLDIAPGRITYTAGKTPIELYPRDPQMSADRARYVTQTPEEEVVTIDLFARACDKAPLTAEVQIGARKLRGCAQAR